MYSMWVGQFWYLSSLKPPNMSRSYANIRHRYVLTTHKLPRCNFWLTALLVVELYVYTEYFWVFDSAFTANDHKGTENASHFPLRSQSCNDMWGYGIGRYRVRLQVTDFSQTWLRYVWLYAMANPSVCRLSCLSSVTCVHLTQGFNFSGIFLHHIVAWPSGNSPTKNHEDHPRDYPQRGR